MNEGRLVLEYSCCTTHNATTYFICNNVENICSRINKLVYQSFFDQLEIDQEEHGLNGIPDPASAAKQLQETYMPLLNSLQVYGKYTDKEQWQEDQFYVYHASPNTG